MVEAPTARTEGLAADRRGVQAYTLGSLHPMGTLVGAEPLGYVFKLRWNEMRPSTQDGLEDPPQIAHTEEAQLQCLVQDRSFTSEAMDHTPCRRVKALFTLSGLTGNALSPGFNCTCPSSCIPEARNLGLRLVGLTPPKASLLRS